MKGENSPPRAWSAPRREGVGARWSTAIDGVLTCIDWDIRRGRANLECAANAEDAVVGLLGRQALDGLLNSLALLGNQVVEPRKRLATERRTKGPGRYLKD